MDVSPLRALAQRWEERAKELRSCGAREAAQSHEKTAQELRDTLRTWLDEPLTLREASSEGGYSTDHLGRLIRNGTLPNAGREGKPRILRRHVPLQPGHGVGPAPESPANEGKPDVPSPTQMARSVVESERGDDDGKR